MGVMRRVESRVESAVGAGPKDSGSDKRPRDRSKRDSRLYVQPAELARKLIKEMDDHKVTSPTGVSVYNRYTVFLCPEDHKRFEGEGDEIAARLGRHLLKHARAKRFELLDEPMVSITVDPDLPLGRFGILAEGFDPSQAEALASHFSRQRGRPAKAATARNGGSSTEGSAGAPARAGRSVGAGRSAGVGAPIAGGSGSQTSAVTAPTAVIPPDEAARLGLVRQTIVLRAGNRVREYNQGRVIVGRTKDADFRVDDPNVSRQHAAIYWDGGRVMIDDLDSTNGTMVNGYPVTSTALRPNDVVVIGNCRMTVETR